MIEIVYGMTGIVILCSVLVSVVTAAKANQIVNELGWQKKHAQDHLTRVEKELVRLRDEVNSLEEFVAGRLPPPKSKPKLKTVASKPKNWKTAVDRAGRLMYDSRGNKIPVKDRKKPD